MKAYQVLVPAFLCVLAAILARTEAEEDMVDLNKKLYEITKELEERLREKNMEEEGGDLLFADDVYKRGIKKASRPWSPLLGQTGIAFGKRNDIQRTRDQTDQRAKKTRSRSMFGHSALAFGKRTEYLPQDLWEFEDANNPLNGFQEVPVKKAMGFTGNTGILLGKRNAENEQD